MSIDNSADTLQLIKLPEMADKQRENEVAVLLDRKEREEIVAPSEEQEMAGTSWDKVKVGWLSPVYSLSRPVRLDTPTVLNNRCIAIDDRIAEVETYRILRAQIMRSFEEMGHGKTLMVTSAVPGEGKTTTAINLAITLAKEFSQTALLVDCDFRQQQVHQVLSYESSKGLVDHLLHDVPLSDIIVWPGIEKLTVISGGKTTNGFSELLGSPRMRRLTEEMRNRYPERFVVFDTPPVLSCADTMALAPLVDGIIVVVRAGKTPRKEIVNALARLPQDKIMGVVLNQM